VPPLAVVQFSRTAGPTGVPVSHTGAWLVRLKLPGGVDPAQMLLGIDTLMVLESVVPAEFRARTK
jgi:hypothetical protein